MILTRLIRRRSKAPAIESRPVTMPGFDRAFYLLHNPDVAASGTDPLEHYLRYGWREGREPSVGFCGKRYLARNPDVQAADINPLLHYLDYGLAEGRVGGGPVTTVHEVAEHRSGSGAELASHSGDAPSGAHGPTRLL